MPTCCADVLIFSVQPGNDGSTNLKSCQCVQSTEFTTTANKGFFYAVAQKIKLCFFPHCLVAALSTFHITVLVYFSTITWMEIDRPGGDINIFGIFW